MKYHVCKLDIFFCLGEEENSWNIQNEKGSFSGKSRYASFIEICTLDFDIFFYKNGNYSLIKKNRGKEY